MLSSALDGYVYHIEIFRCSDELKGSDDPERLNVNKINGPVKIAAEEQLNKILHEFPWLWALENPWCHQYDKVVIKSVDEGFFDRKCQTPAWAWIITRDLYSRESEVSQLSQINRNIPIAIAIQNELTRHSKTLVLEYLVTRDSFEQAWPKEVDMPSNPALRRFYKKYTIYRSKSCTSLHSIFDKHIRSK